MPIWLVPPDLHHSIEPGPTCFFAEHSIGSKDGLVPRYTDSQACVRCVSSLSEGRLSLDVHRIHKVHRRKFLEFWSFAEIGEPEECWEWHGTRVGARQTLQFSIRRHWNFGARFSPHRVAAWFTWGDIGRLPIRMLCNNGACCNPLHMRIRGVPHYFNNRKIDYIDLEFNTHKLMHDTQLFLETTREKDPRTWKRLNGTNEAWIEFRMSQEESTIPTVTDETAVRELRSEYDDDVPEFDDPLM